MFQNNKSCSKARLNVLSHFGKFTEIIISHPTGISSFSGIICFKVLSKFESQTESRLGLSFYIVSSFVTSYSLRPKLYDVLDISHILRNVINIVWEIDIMSCFTKLSLINYMGKIN